MFTWVGVLIPQLWLSISNDGKARLKSGLLLGSLNLPNEPVQRSLQEEGEMKDSQGFWRNQNIQQDKRKCMEEKLFQS